MEIPKPSEQDKLARGARAIAFMSDMPDIARLAAASGVGPGW